MDQHLKQTFDFRYVNIRAIVNGGVLQIGCGAGQKKHRTQPLGYTTVGTSLVPLSAPLQFAVPLKAPAVRNDKI